MGTLRDIALKYIDKGKDYGEQANLYYYNCAEILLNASNDYYNLEAGNALKAIIPFGGGMCSEKACGALTGGVAALGLMFAEQRPTTNENLKNITKEFIMRFEKKFANLDCKKLKEDHRDPDSGCKSLILETAELLESVINQYK